MRRHLHRPGVTLIEMTVVIALILTLTTLSFTAFFSAKQYADRIESEAADAIARVHRGPVGSLPGAQPIGAAPQPTAPARPRPEIVPGEYFVGLHPAANNPAATAQRLAGLAGGVVDGVYTRGVFGFYLKCPSGNVTQLTSDPAVSFVEPSRYAYPCQVPTNIRRINSNGIMGNSFRWNLTTGPPGRVYGVPPTLYRFDFGVSARPTLPVTSRTFFPTGNTAATIRVAIMDTGIDNTHPDLFVVGAFDATGGGNPMDTSGHGTHVAGVVGAADRSTAGGVVGVYPGAPLVNVKVMNATAAGPPSADLGAAGTTGTVLAGLDFVLQNAGAIKVCLMSFTMTAALPATVDAMVNTVGNSGVLMVAAAGNNGAGAQFSPATAAESIRVGALADSNGLPGGVGWSSITQPAGIVGDDTLTGYSNRVNLDFVAPGGDTAVGFYTIRSTVPMANLGLPGFVTTPYAQTINGTTGVPNATGTSFAAAHVAGMLALVIDPTSEIGFIVGGRGVSTFRLTMTNRAGAVAGLLNLTRRPETIQTINKATGSMWMRVPLPGTPLVRVLPFTINLNADTVVGGPGAGTPVANFYANPMITTRANLFEFPGNTF